MEKDRVDDGQIPISPNEQKPLSCRDHAARSTQDCLGPLRGNITCQYCPKTRLQRQEVEKVVIKEER